MNIQYIFIKILNNFSIPNFFNQIFCCCCFFFHKKDRATVEYFYFNLIFFRCCCCCYFISMKLLFDSNVQVHHHGIVCYAPAMAKAMNIRRRTIATYLLMCINILRYARLFFLQFCSCSCSSSCFDFGLANIVLDVLCVCENVGESH